MVQNKNKKSWRQIQEEEVAPYIYWLRGRKVMLSGHLASLYGVGAKVLIQSVKRNKERFPNDFMFQLTWGEVRTLRSQFVTLRDKKKQGGHMKYKPYAFTEQGIAMLSSALRSKRAVQVNITIMRTFVKFRGIFSAHKKLAGHLEKLQEKVNQHAEEIQTIFQAIKELIGPLQKPKGKIGFH